MHHTMNSSSAKLIVLTIQSKLPSGWKVKVTILKILICNYAYITLLNKNALHPRCY